MINRFFLTILVAPAIFILSCQNPSGNNNQSQSSPSPSSSVIPNTNVTWSVESEKKYTELCTQAGPTNQSIINTCKCSLEKVKIQYPNSAEQIIKVFSDFDTESQYGKDVQKFGVECAEKENQK